MKILIGESEKKIQEKISKFVGSIKKMKFPSDCYNICITNLEKTEDYIHYKILGIEVIYKSEGTMWTSNAKSILKVNQDGYGDIHFYLEKKDDIIYLSEEDVKNIIFEKIKEYTFLFD